MCLLSLSTAEPHPLFSTIRLVAEDGSEGNSGLLEIAYNGEWLPVSTGGPSGLTFGQSTANAVCSQLGLGPMVSLLINETSWLSETHTGSCAGFTCGESCFNGGWSERLTVQDVASWSPNYCIGNQAHVTCRWDDLLKGEHVCSVIPHAMQCFRHFSTAWRTGLMPTCMCLLGAAPLRPNKLFCCPAVHPLLTQLPRGEAGALMCLGFRLLRCKPFAKAVLMLMAEPKWKLYCCSIQSHHACDNNHD